MLLSLPFLLGLLAGWLVIPMLLGMLTRATGKAAS